MLLIVGWLGAAALAVAPFIIDRPYGKWLAIAGLFLLTFQAIDLSAWNFVCLNICGIAGYFRSLLK